MENLSIYQAWTGLLLLVVLAHVALIGSIKLSDAHNPSTTTVKYKYDTSTEVFDTDTTGNLFISGVLYFDDCVIQWSGVLNPLTGEESIHSTRYTWEDWEDPAAE